jgi:hypothetical protein
MGKCPTAKNIEILVTYNIDGSENYTLPIELTTINPNFSLTNLGGLTVMPLLSAGNHSITVYGKWTLSTYKGPNQPFDDVVLAQNTLDFTV